MSGRQMKIEHPLQSDKGICFSEVITRRVNTSIPPGDETINSNFVDRGRSLMDLQSNPLLHFLVRMKPTSINFFLQIKNVEVTSGKIWDVRQMLESFPTKFMKLIHHQIGSMGTDVIMQKDDSVRQHSRAFWLSGASQCSSTISQQETNHTSLLFFACLHFQCRTNTLHYAHLKSNKETTVWTCAFSLCMTPTLQMAVAIPSYMTSKFICQVSNYVKLTTGGSLFQSCRW